MIEPLTDDELTFFEEGQTCCFSCKKWFDMKGQPPLMEYTCDTCGDTVITPLRISTFWLYKLIGEGGMGHVYLAQQKDDPNMYAIKIQEFRLWNQILDELIQSAEHALSQTLLRLEKVHSLQSSRFFS